MTELLDFLHFTIALPVYFAARLVSGQCKAFWHAVKEAWLDA